MTQVTQVTRKRRGVDGIIYRFKRREELTIRLVPPLMQTDPIRLTTTPITQAPGMTRWLGFVRVVWREVLKRREVDRGTGGF